MEQRVSRALLDIEDVGEARVELVRRLPDGFVLTVNGAPVTVRPGAGWMVDGAKTDVRMARVGEQTHVEIGGEVWIVSARSEIGGGPDAGRAENGVFAPMSGEIVSVAAAVDGTVEAGAELVVLESMKLHMSLLSPRAGRVVEVLAMPGRVVAKGELLVRLADDMEDAGAAN
jgi:3-methylcrotonyl-CoA carboxylase alpha subunit